EALKRIAAILERKPVTVHSTDDVFSFLSAKAGDGTSTAALNISAALARGSDARTLIADFDLNLGMVSFLLQITQGRSILDAIEHVGRLDDTLWNTLVAKRDGLEILGSGRLNSGSTLDRSKLEEVLHFARRTYRAVFLDLSSNRESYTTELLH